MRLLARICFHIPNNTRIFATLHLPIPFASIDIKGDGYEITGYRWGRLSCRIPYRDEMWS